MVVPDLDRRFNRFFHRLSAKLDAIPPERLTLFYDATKGAHGPQGIIFAFVFTPDNKQLITMSGWDNSCRTWDIATGEVRRIRPMPGKGVPYLSPDGKTLLNISSGAFDNSLQVTQLPDFSSKKLAVSFAGAAFFAPDGRTVLLGGYLPGNNCKLLRLPEGEIKPLVFQGTNFVFSADSKYLVRHKFDPNSTTVTLFRVAELEKIQGFSFHEFGVGGGLPKRFNGNQYYGFTADQKSIFYLRPDQKEMAFVDLATGKIKNVKLDANAMNAWSYCVSHDNKTIAAMGQQSILVYDADGNLRKQLNLQNQAAPGFTSDSRYLLTYDKDRIDVATGEVSKIPPDEAKKASVPTQIPSGFLVVGMDRPHAYSADGQWQATLVSGNGNTEILVAKMADGKVLHRFQVIASSQSPWPSGATVAWSADGKSIAWGNRSFHLTEMKLGPALGKENIHAAVHKQEPLSFAASKDEIKLLKDGKETKLSLKVPPHQVTFLGTKTFAVVQDGAIAVHEIDEIGDTLGVKTTRKADIGNTACQSLAPSPDGRFLMIADRDGIVQIHDIRQRKHLLSAIVVGDEWAIWSAENYYSCSKDGEKILRCRVDSGKDAIYYSAMYFRKQLQRPEITKSLFAADQ